MKNLFKNKWVSRIALIIIGIVVGWVIKPTGSVMQDPDQMMEASEHEHELGTIYTCSMHPQIQKDKPGNCPLCGMELIPLESDDEGDIDGEYTVKLSNVAMKIAEVSTSIVERKTPYKEVYLPGKVMPDERRISELTARYPGRIEKLHVNFTGQKVRKGQVLAQIYSPELVTAQKELLEARKFKDTNPNYYRAVRNKLKLWDISENQIDEIANSGEVQFYFNVLSPLTGTVTVRMVSLGDYVKEGTSLFEIIDLTRVWVMFDAYESDIPWIKNGDKIKFKVKSIPSMEFESTVTFIDPVLNPKTRVAGVRTELSNPQELLKPQMLASGLLKSMLPGSDNQLMVPKSAVLWTGKKAVVYVRTNDHDNMFRFTEVSLGADAGESYVVLTGLNEGELVASNGVFKIDAAAQLKGEKSMMNPGGGKQSLGGHAGMDMGDENKVDTEIKEEVDHSEHQENDGVMNMEFDPEFTKQLTRVFDNYIVLKDALVASDMDAAIKAGSTMETTITKVNMGLLKGDAHLKWMEDLENINGSLKTITSVRDIEKQRLAFADLGTSLYASIIYFKVDGLGAYYQFCPMARDGEGAFWLSTSDEIKNPFYGEAMLTCGETKEIIN